MKRVFLFLLLLFPGILFSQATEIDSLKLLLNRQDDSVKVQILIDIYENYEQGKILLGKEYLDQALELVDNWVTIP